jgi:hypothetical protein
MGDDGSAMRDPLRFSKETGKRKAPGATAQGMSDLDSLISRVHHNSAYTI